MKTLFFHKDPYDTDGTRELFLREVRENLAYLCAHSGLYRKWMKQAGLAPDDVRTEEDLARIPPVPTLYFKRNRIFTVPEESCMMRVTSSGTGGIHSRIGFDKPSFACAMAMVGRFFRYHGLLSAKGTNYIVLAFPPEKGGVGASHTVRGATWLAPPLHRTYAFHKNQEGGYDADMQGVVNALKRYANSRHPVRFLGFPAYLYELLRHLEKEGLRFRLHPGSRVLFGGGWKRLAKMQVDETVLKAMIERTLGIAPDHVHEFFSAVEHPVPYTKCRCGHFHVPVYSRVIVRDPETLAVCRDGEDGILNFITPLLDSMPLVSVLTDDIGTLHREECACGIRAPWFELKGRAGVSQIKTCVEGGGIL